MVGEVNEKYFLEHLDINGRIILKWICRGIKWTDEYCSGYGPQ
jgi:hypothetical protein